MPHLLAKTILTYSDRWWGTVKDREYYHRDLLGSTALLTDKFGMVRERYRYDAFGNHYAGNFKRFNELGYTGKRYDSTTGLYNYGFRDYDAESGRFTTVDPIRDGSNWYAYCGNDPVNKVDLIGLKPGDVFPTIDDAAIDFGNEYNGRSIEDNREYGTTIIPEDDGYTYMEPTVGTVDAITLPTPSGGADEAVAGAHTHSAYDSQYDGNNFSDTDRETAEAYQKPFYVAMPDGSLKVYDPTTDAERLVSTDMPSDPNDPNRKNDNDPSTKPGKEGD